MKKIFNKNKKGSADFLLLLIIIWFMGVLFVIGGAIWEIAETSAQEDVSGVAAQHAMMGVTRFVDSFDYLFVTVMILASIGLIATGFLLSSHPFFWIAFIPILAIAVYLTPLLANVYDDIVKDEGEFQEEEAELTIIPFTFQYFPHFTVVIGTIYGIVLFGKSRREGGFT